MSDKRLRVYLAGPMTGVPDYNTAGFHAAAEYATAHGWEPVDPHHTDPTHAGDCPPGERHKGHPNTCWYTAGARLVATCDAVLMLPGWQDSHGARLEHAEAARLGLPIHHVTGVTA